MDRSNEPFAVAFADALREVRQTAGMTQEDLAERADVSLRFISFLETGKHQPTLSALAAVSAGLGMPMRIMAVESRVAVDVDKVESGNDTT